MIFVDTSVWVDYLRLAVTPKTAELHYLLADHPEELVFGDLVAFELYAGLRSRRERTALERVAGNLFAVEISGLPAAIAAGDRYATLRRRGITIRSSVDTLIASYCIDHNYELLDADRDFDHFVTHFGLRRYVPPASVGVT